MDNPEKQTINTLELDSIMTEANASSSRVNKVGIVDDEASASKFAELEPQQAVDFISEMLFELRRCAAAQNLSHLVYFIEMAILAAREIQEKTMAHDEMNTKAG